MPSKEHEILSFDYEFCKNQVIDIEVDGTMKRINCQLFWPPRKAKPDEWTLRYQETFIVEKNNGSA